MWKNVEIPLLQMDVLENVVPTNSFIEPVVVLLAALIASLNATDILNSGTQSSRKLQRPIDYSFLWWF